MMLFADPWRTPWLKSPLVFFTGEFSAPLVGTTYVWPSTLQDFQPAADLTNQAIYFFWDFDFAADISEEDFSSAIVDTPLVSVYLSAKPNEPIFRQPFRCPKFYENKMVMQGRKIEQTPNRLQFGITGTIRQTPELIGKTAIKAIVQFTCFEISEPDFKKQLIDGVMMPDPPVADHFTAGRKQLTEAERKIVRETSQHPETKTPEGLSFPL